MSSYFLVVGALRSAALKMNGGASPKDALNAVADELVNAANLIDNQKMKTKKSFTEKSGDRLILVKEQLLQGNFNPDWSNIKRKSIENGAELDD